MTLEPVKRVSLDRADVIDIEIHSQNYRFHNWLLFVLLLACMLMTARPGAAQIDPWEFEVYPDATESRVIELETDNAVVANGHSEGAIGTAAGNVSKPRPVVQRQRTDLRPR
jgi:hypothetical protein